MPSITDNFDESAANLAHELRCINVKDAVHTRDTNEYVTLQRDGFECTIEASFQRLSPRNRITDDDGNDFLPFELRILISQSFNGAELELATKRTEFVLECCRAAQRIKALFAPRKVYALLQSAQDKADRIHEANKEAVAKSLIENCKGMRKGQVRQFTDSSLVSGDYHIKIKDKVYFASVGTVVKGAVSVNRIS